MGATKSPLRVMVAHNRYQQPGGEDAVFASEVAMLRSAGCEVATLEVSNDSIGMGKVKAALGATYSFAGRKLAAEVLAQFKPDVLHVHNFFPLLSPALFDACRQAGVPAVWTLHNFRVGCASGLLFREGRPCEDCIGRVPLPAITHRCYRGSTLGSASVAAMISYHRARGTYRNKVARFIALSDFARDIVVRAGLPREKVTVKPNFVADPMAEAGNSLSVRAGALFVGRLSAEKGAATMIKAWRSLPAIPLTVIGDGPERAALERAAPSNVRFMGQQPREAVLAAMANAQALVLPSEWYENFPMALVEAMAMATPVIASRIGALETLVTHDHNGLHFTPGNVADLARVVGEAFLNPAQLDRLGRRSRATWQATMSPESNLKQLLAIYHEAMAA